MAIIFHIVRHGETLLNKLNRAQGWSDSPLTNHGRTTAIELGAMLKDIHFKAAYASDTIRAVQTAELILSSSGNHHVKVQSDNRLREWCLGTMDGELNSVFIQTVSEWLGGVSSFEELNKRLPDVASVIYHHDTTGMAESFENILSRLKNAFLDFTQNELPDENSNILVATHAFVIKTLFYLFAPEELCAIGKVKNTAIITLIYDHGCFKFAKTEK